MKHAKKISSISQRGNISIRKSSKDSPNKPKKSPMAKSNSQQKLMNKTFNGGITSSVPGILRNSNMQKPSMKEFMNKTANSFKLSLKESKSLIDHRQLIPIQKKRSIVSKLQGKNI